MHHFHLPNQKVKTCEKMSQKTHCEEWLKVGIFHLFYHMLGLCQWAFHEQTALTFASKIVFYPNCITLATIL